MGNIEYEKRVVEQMIRLYCRKKHREVVLCQKCELLKTYTYAFQRLTKCPFGNDKTACKRCKVHCYNKEMRERISYVMRFSGPRMLLYYPKDFLIHIIKNRL